MIKIITGLTFKSCVSFVMPTKFKFTITKFLCGASPNQMSNYEDRQSFHKRKSSPSSPRMGKSHKKKNGSNQGNQRSGQSKGDGGKSQHGAGKGNNLTQARKHRDSDSSQRSREGHSKHDGRHNHHGDSPASSYSEEREPIVPTHLGFVAWDENDEKEHRKIKSKDGETKGKKGKKEKDKTQASNHVPPGAPQELHKVSGSSVDKLEDKRRPSLSEDAEKKASATRQTFISEHAKSTGSNQQGGNRQTQSYGSKEPQYRPQQVQTSRYIPGLSASNSAQRSNEQSMAEQGISINELNRAPECFTNLLTSEEIFQSLYNHVSFVGSIPSITNECFKRQYPVFVNTPLSDAKKYQGGKSRWEWVNNILFNRQNRPIRHEGDLQVIIQQLRQLDSRKPENFAAFFRFFEEMGNKNGAEYVKFFNKTLPAMTHLASELPNMHLNELPFLKKGMNLSLTLSQKQVACLLSHAFFCTFPNRPGRKEKGHEVPDINFSSLYSVFEDADKPWKAEKEIKRKVEKLKCLVHYFMRVTDRMPDGNITYQRLYDDCKNVDWHCSKQELTKLYVDTDSTIEEVGRGMLQADFANKFVGGGVLTSGLVQEEIRFVLCPEMILSRLFTEALTDREVLLMIGCERFSNYSGYSDSFQFTGPHQDNTQRDALGRRFTEVVAMDALVFKSNKEAQFQPRHIARELNKAYVAFKAQPLNQVQPAVCTGNWGCGAFGGDKQLKALIQIMAASVAGRDVCYVTFKERELDRLSYIHQLLTTKNMAIRDVVTLLEAYYNTVYRNKDVETLFDFLEDKVSSGKVANLPPPTNWNFSDNEQPNYKQSGGKHWDSQRKDDDKYRPEHPRYEDSRASHTNQNAWRNVNQSHSAGHQGRKSSGDDGSDAADIFSGSILSDNYEGVGDNSEVTQGGMHREEDKKDGSCGTQGANGRCETGKKLHGDSKPMLPGNTGDSHQ